MYIYMCVYKYMYITNIYIYIHISKTCSGILKSTLQPRPWRWASSRWAMPLVLVRAVSLCLL